MQSIVAGSADFQRPNMPCRGRQQAILRHRYEVIPQIDELWAGSRRKLHQALDNASSKRDVKDGKRSVCMGILAAYPSLSAKVRRLAARCCKRKVK